ncbi:hypothetical protein CspeluHIS016_0901920 [Cutaneotrichosporon spelunceum]|uniref:Ysc84 actin-binding domain-containing protein n=1 Tax=Cutaneotrichosporon spelunceum TaxID=1672016 RepID=A0AAD3YE76_9TREE|nr:hypothetical protein CspeluHIS016_0901920 [Cutaneotrichosporon spelunceum]
MSPWGSKKADTKRGLSPNNTAANPPSHAPRHGWGAKALNLSDKLGGKFNDYTDKWGIESFWPTTGDMTRELEKAARILKSFTLPDSDPHAAAAPVHIPPSVIANARGIAIYSCFRTGWAPVGGGGGSGVVLARLPDGSWSAPAAICPTAVGAGMQIGLDVYNAVLVIRSDKALAQFGGHRAALGGEISVAAGPYGGGKGVDKGVNLDKGISLDKGPEVYVYMHSRGAYFGLEVVGTVFVSRADENAAMYHWPGIKASDILRGKVRVPQEAANLMQALRAAETGEAHCPTLAAYGPGFSTGDVSHGATRVFSGYDSGKAGHSSDARTDGGVEGNGAGPSVPRPHLSPLQFHSPVSRSTGASPVGPSPARCSPGGTRFVPPLPGRRISPLPADEKSEAPPPYSPAS